MWLLQNNLVIAVKFQAVAYLPTEICVFSYRACTFSMWCLHVEVESKSWVEVPLRLNIETFKVKSRQRVVGILAGLLWPTGLQVRFGQMNSPCPGGYRSALDGISQLM